MSSPRPVLIIDAQNLFIRSWAAYPTVSGHGYQMGGCIGFLKTLRRLVDDMMPSAVYVCWEGGGSARRRAIFPDYKMKRKPVKLNRFYEDDLPESQENEQHQLTTLIKMMKCVPVCQLYAADCEGDDLVAYLCCGPLRGHDKVIVSSDKDLYQLLDERTKTYSLHKKTFVTKDDVMAEFRVQSKHFGLAKALCGDPGDNVPGVKGCGFKTVARLFPFLGLDGALLLQDVIDYAHTHADESKVYQRIVEQQDIVRRAWRLVYLDGGMLSATQKQAIDGRVDAFVPRIDKVGLIRHMVAEGIGSFDVDEFFFAFRCIDGMQLRAPQQTTGDK